MSQCKNLGEEYSISNRRIIGAGAGGGAEAGENADEPGKRLGLVGHREGGEKSGWGYFRGSSTSEIC